MNDSSDHEIPSTTSEMADAKPAVAGRAKKAPEGLSIAIVSWLVPGLGHFLLGREGRAILFFIAVGGLAMIGSLMRGNVFPPRSVDPFGTLGCLADAASGVLYLLARVFERAGPDVSRAAGDYGTRFIAAAGVVNLIAAFDAYEIATGRRR